MKARTLTRSGMPTSPAFTSTRKRTRSQLCEGNQPEEIATTSDAGLLFIRTSSAAFCLESESRESAFS